MTLVDPDLTPAAPEPAADAPEAAATTDLWIRVPRWLRMSR